MRVRIIFSLKNRGASIPFHHQYLLAQTVKGITLKGGDEQYIRSTSYNFSGLKGLTKISREGLHFYSNRVTLVLSSDDKGFINYFLRNLFNFEKLEIGNLVLVPENVEKEGEPELAQEMKFICISPVVLINPNFNDERGKKFISPLADNFSEMLYESTIQRMGSSKNYSPEELSRFYQFQVEPDQDYLNKIKEQQKKFARIYPVYEDDVKYEVRGYTFPFTFKAPKEVQEFVFTNGLGLFTYKGFGMLDLAHSDPSKRTERYEFESMV